MFEELIINALNDYQDGIIILDLTGRMVFSNRLAKQWFILPDQFTNEEFVNIFKACCKQDPDTLSIIINALLEERISQVQVETIKNKSLDVSFVPILDSKNQVVGKGIYLHDNKGLKEVEKSKTDFLSVVSHQLRTPLGSIKWNMEMLIGGDMGEITPPVKETLMEIYQSIQRMLTFVTDFLIVSRIDQNRVSDLPVEIEIINVINDVIKELKFVSNNKITEIEVVRVNNCNPRLTIDSQRFRDVIQNILSNAVKYNLPNNKIIVTVMQNQNMVQISVADNGIGIPDENRDKIFSKFYRASNAVQASGEGSGLGLYVAKSYIEAWGGKIWFESTKGKGTTFYFTLPNNPIQHALDNNLNKGTKVEEQIK